MTPNQSPARKSPSGPKSIPNPPLEQDSEQRPLSSTEAKKKLYHLLGQYTSFPEYDEEERKPRKKIKFKQPDSKLNSRVSHTSATTQTPKIKESSRNLYRCCTVFQGPHSWSKCPRRNSKLRVSGGQQPQRKRSKSASSLSRQKMRQEPVARKTSRNRARSSPPETRDITSAPVSSSQKPRFWVPGRVDSKLLARRDFCGNYPSTCSTSAKGKSTQEEKSLKRRFEGRGKEKRERPKSSSYQGRKATLSPWSTHQGQEERLATPSPRPQYASCTSKTCTYVGSSHESSEDSGSETQTEESHPSCSSSRNTHPDSLLVYQSTSADSNFTRDSFFVSSRQHTTVVRRGDLPGKYIQHGNRRMRVESPARVIGDKVNTLLHNCCEFRVSVWWV